MKAVHLNKFRMNFFLFATTRINSAVENINLIDSGV